MERVPDEIRQAFVKMSGAAGCSGPHHVLVLAIAELAAQVCRVANSLEGYLK